MAVVSQPFDRSTRCEAPGDPSTQLGEFWEEDPWNIALKHNLSAFERNRTFLNVDGRGFLDVSGVSGADNDGDSRAAVAADLDHDGDQDLLLRQVGGGPLVVYRNDFPRTHWLDVSLRGRTSNRLGIGARLIANVGDRPLVRELYPVNSFHSQALSRVHFGLGDNESLDRLEIWWPSGQTQTLSHVAADRHIVITEGHPDIETVTPGTTVEP
jgi:hypothetical protein